MKAVFDWSFMVWRLIDTHGHWTNNQGVWAWKDRASLKRQLGYSGLLLCADNTIIVDPAIHRRRATHA